jgi:hypothetical protein
MSSVGKKMGKALRKTGSKSKVQIPKKYLQIGVVLFCVFILGGGFYNLLENPPIAIPLQSGVSSLHPYLSEQTATEGYVVMLTNLFMVAGFWLTHKASQVTYDKPKANRYLMMGIFLIAIGLASNYAILRIKRGLL